MDSTTVSNDLPGDVPFPEGKYITIGSDVMLWMNKSAQLFSFGRVENIKVKDKNKLEQHALWDSVTHQFIVTYYKVTSSSVGDPPLSCRLVLNTSSGLKSSWLSMNRLIQVVQLTQLPHGTMSQGSELLKRWDDTAHPSWSETHPKANLHCDPVVSTHLVVNVNVNVNVSALSTQDTFISPMPRKPSQLQLRANPAKASASTPICAEYEKNDSDSSIHDSGRMGIGIPTITGKFYDEKTHMETLSLTWPDGLISSMTSADFKSTYGETSYAFGKQRRLRKRQRAHEEASLSDAAAMSMSQSEDSLTEPASDTENEHETPSKRHCAVKTVIADPTCDKRDASAASDPAKLLVPATTTLASAGFNREAGIRVCPIQQLALITHSALYVVPSTVVDLTTLNHACFYASVWHQLMLVTDYETEDYMVKKAKKEVKDKVLNHLKQRDSWIVQAISREMSQSVPLTAAGERQVSDQLLEELKLHTDVVRLDPNYYRTVAESVWRIKQQVQTEACIEQCLREFSTNTAAADTYIIHVIANMLNIPICILWHRTNQTSSTTIASSHEHTVCPYYWCWPTKEIKSSARSERKASASAKPRLSKKPVPKAASAQSMGCLDIRDMQIRFQSMWRNIFIVMLLFLDIYHRAITCLWWIVTLLSLQETRDNSAGENWKGIARLTTNVRCTCSNHYLV